MVTRLSWLRGKRGRSTKPGEVAIAVGLGAAGTVARITGSLTIDSARYVRTEVLNLLTKRPRERLVLDMEGVTYMDAAGIVILLEAVIAARQLSVKLRVAGLGGQARRLAEITELSTIFASAESEVI